MTQQDKKALTTLAVCIFFFTIAIVISYLANRAEKRSLHSYDVYQPPTVDTTSFIINHSQIRDADTVQ